MMIENNIQEVKQFLIENFGSVKDPVRKEKIKNFIEELTNCDLWDMSAKCLDITAKRYRQLLFSIAIDIQHGLLNVSDYEEVFN